MGACRGQHGGGRLRRRRGHRCTAGARVARRVLHRAAQGRLQGPPHRKGRSPCAPPSARRVLMDLRSLGFARVWVVDFEFTAPPGECPRPICLVARELGTGSTVRLWEDELRRRTAPPYPIDRDSLFVAYYASAEMGCHLALGWPLPPNVLDLYVEFRHLTNGLNPPCGKGLLGALAAHGLDAMNATEKESMRQLAMRGGPWTE